MEKKENATKINPDDLLDILFKKKMEGGDSLTEVKDCETIKELYDLVSAVYVQFGNAVEITDVLTSLKEKNEVSPEIEQLTLSAIEKIKTYRAGLLEKSHMGQCFDMALYSYLVLVDNMAKAGEEYEWLRAKVSELARETAFLFEALYPGRDAQAIEALTDPYSLEKVMKGEELTSTDPVTLDKDEAYKMFDLCEKLAAEMSKKPDADPADLVEAFIRSEYKSESDEPIFDKLSFIRKSNHATMSTSKPSKKMTDIALIPGGTPVDVGGTGKYRAEIFARIGDDESKPYSPSHVHRHLQDVIGQLGEENGYPLTLTPAQIYRAFAGLDRDTHVYPEQENEIIKAMDAMIFTPANIDFTEQVEKHKGVKERDETFDYTKAKLSGHLITGEKGSIKRGEISHTAYTIYSPPIFFRYSKAVGQLKQVDIRLLSGVTRKNFSKAERESGAAPHRSKTSASGGTRNTLIRRYLADRVTDMEKKYKAYRKKGEEMPVHERKIAFTSIANESDTILTPKTIRTIRDTTDRILNDFVSLKQIKGFELYKVGSRYMGVTISF